MDPRPLPYTFANHMHWVDMQWLWGYQVLPDCIDDMLALCEAVGAKGGVNFDGVGYEKLATEDPAALQRLREAVQQGRVEIVGGSHGQPYGLFLGGESNARQRIFGARTIRRLLGVWPRTFMEEEFDFCPQLPQILKGCGFTGASLFFQWTWHTPTVPEEDTPLVQWEGIDGTRLNALAKTKLCLHQWPEDFDGKLELALQTEQPALVQWVELMPSPDWMCRSEVLMPRLRELFADQRFEMQPCTPGELIAKLERDAPPPIRRYTLDDVFHGMTLGKNADAVPRRSDFVESRLLAAESLSATTGLLGRPYASWDVHPAWEIDEAWRELLQAQHHDNHECEGLCGSVGKASFDRAATLGTDLLLRLREHLARHLEAEPGDSFLVLNPLGWERDILVPQSRAMEEWGDEGPGRLARDVPAYGWRVVTRDDTTTRLAPRVTATETDAELVLEGGSLTAHVARATGRLTALRRGDTALDLDLGGLRVRVGDAAIDFGTPTVELRSWMNEPCVTVTWDTGFDGPHPLRVVQRLRLRPEHEGLSLTTHIDRLPRPAGGYAGALRLELAFAGGAAPELVTDSPFAVHPVRADAVGRDRRKYPRGDWMTSEQWFESVDRMFTARSFVDLGGTAGDLLCIHDGSQGWLRTDRGVEVVLHAYDPWDEEHCDDDLHGELLLVPHLGALSPADMARRAAEFRAPELIQSVTGGTGRTGFPATFGLLDCRAVGVRVEACYREHRKAFEHVENAFGPDVRNPYVVRLVEYDGNAADVTLRLPGPCARAARTDLLGAVTEPLPVAPATPPDWSPPGLTWSQVRFAMRPREIATVMLDLELGRHQPRHLDQHRHIWATVHRTDRAAEA